MRVLALHTPLTDRAVDRAFEQVRAAGAVVLVRLGPRATGNFVAACLARMGSAAALAMPQIHAELARPKRAGWLRSVSDDEALLRELAGILPVG